MASGIKCDSQITREVSEDDSGYESLDENILDVEEMEDKKFFSELTKPDYYLRKLTEGSPCEDNSPGLSEAENEAKSLGQCKVNSPELRKVENEDKSPGLRVIPCEAKSNVQSKVKKPINILRNI